VASCFSPENNDATCCFKPLFSLRFSSFFSFTYAFSLIRENIDNDSELSFNNLGFGALIATDSLVKPFPALKDSFQR